ncbi:hypothetical protein M0R45_002330 [Rubus argutus]|uniref:Uncharacterized protein n=1 Tax=Rubus argutus TaxID=59490 RepID=A0AAW1VJA5_RUBAR
MNRRRLKDQNPAPASDPSALPPCPLLSAPPPPSPHRVLSSAVAALAEAPVPSRDAALITTTLYSNPHRLWPPVRSCPVLPRRCLALHATVAISNLVGGLLQRTEKENLQQ